MGSPPRRSCWTAAAARSAPGGDPEALGRNTADGLREKALYTAADTAGLPHTDTLPGFAPFVRGPHATMYAVRPWTIRQYAGFSTAEESNAFYRQSLAAGGQGLSVAFDLPTHRGYDSDHTRVAADVGKAGGAVDSVEDMKALFAGIPLGEVGVSMTISGAVLPVLAAYIVAAEEQGVPQAALRGTIQNDILKEYLVRNTYVYPPAPSLRITGDIVAYTARHMPRYNAMSISGYHLQEAGAPQVLELALTLANGMEYVRTAIARGLDVDAFAGRLSFFWGVGMDFYAEIAKLRAARLLWSRIMQGFGARDPRSLALRAHCQTSGWSLAAQEPLNNVVRTTVEAMAAVFGGTQSLHTNALDEALALPTEASARLARNTQLILQEETHIGGVIDPWAGSYLMERLTQDMADAAWQTIREVETLGGTANAIASGWAQRRIEAAAAQQQARIESGQDVVVGMNRHRAAGGEAREAEPPTRDIDGARVREEQARRLRTLRAGRDAAAVQAALRALTQAAARNVGNLLELSITAMRCRATVGEVTAALAEVFGHHEAPTRAAGIPLPSTHASPWDADPHWMGLRQEIAAFTAEHGGPPRLLIAKLGQDGHDRGAKVVATAFADLGFVVEQGPLFQTPEECARLAVQRGVHAVGVSSLAAGHRLLVPALARALREQAAEPVTLFVGGVVPRRDHGALYQAGVAGIFGPGTPLAHSAREVLRHIRDALAGRAGARRAGA